MALTLDIVTPERRVLSVACDEVRAPGVQGGFGIRTRHTPFMSALEPGKLTYVEGGREHHFAVGGGFLQVADDKVIVLADTAEAASDIDVDRAVKALADAQEKLKKLTQDDRTHAEEMARVRRAAARLGVVGK
ncbi:MAG: F0F1 ATP synthase subunit epsilon [Anaeromyxobacter sp.]|nr:F0F1 ATP synthase subunit epsilon [Anaeromyxobacter sp.]MBL0278388.1 F0F1 ATP synthase subunit epsilon [Anaeromyxobacter sp.]